MPGTGQRVLGSHFRLQRRDVICLTGGGRQLGQSEIHDLGLSTFGEKNICGLDITVDNSTRVCCIQCICNLNSNIQEPIDFQWSSFDRMLERFPFQQFHGNEVNRRIRIGYGGRVDVVDRTNVRMIQTGCRLRLPLESFQSLRVTGQLGGRNFRATLRRSFVSSAEYTTPIPPPPRWSRIL